MRYVIALGMAAVLATITASQVAKRDNQFTGVVSAPLLTDDAPAEAPASYLAVTNGLLSQADFLAARANFMEAATDTDDPDEGGLGPLFNAPSCKDCHNNPVVGAGSQIFELRAGNWDGIAFTAPPGGTLIRHRATRIELQQHVPENMNTRGRRSSLSVLGDGYADVLEDAAILANRDNQPADMRGFATTVDFTTGIGPDGKARKAKGVGRFGHKGQHKKILDFCADAKINELGQTSPIEPTEPLSVDGSRTDDAKLTTDPEDVPVPGKPFGNDVTDYTRFIKSTKMPPVNRSLSMTADVIEGKRLFNEIGCAICHTPTWKTPPAGTQFPGEEPVPAALANKLFHPYTDYLLHDIGSSDGIQQGQAQTRTRQRTTPLAGIQGKTEYFRDGLTYTLMDCVKRHDGEAANVRKKFLQELAPDQQRRVVLFVGHL